MDRKIFSRPLSRREFCRTCVVGGTALAFFPGLFKRTFSRPPAVPPAPKSGEKGFLNRCEAAYYERLDAATVRCRLCPRGCTLSEGARSFCRVREAKAGKLLSLVYGSSTSVHVDPIEKKPLFHFLPGTAAFSLATAGCNFRCQNCQNWQISQFPPEETVNFYLPPEEVVRNARACNCPTIAYTYTEPTIFYEYMLATARIARREGLKNMYHSNGFINPAPAEELAGYLDGANIDLKGFTREFYALVPGGELAPVLETIKILHRQGVHLELTCLIIPTLNDDPDVIGEMCRWVRNELGENVPLHFSRFYPSYRLKNLPPTPVETLERAHARAREAGLRFVYIGNVPGHPAENTYCPADGKMLIRRTGYIVEENNVVNGRCRFCGQEIPGVWGVDRNAAPPPGAGRQNACRFIG